LWFLIVGEFRDRETYSDSRTTNRGANRDKEMATALVQSVVTPQDALGARPRILIVRSCRMAQLLNAVVLARMRNRDAEIVVLSHRGHRHLLRAAGADRVIEVPGRRFGLLRLAPWTLARLRSERFSEIIIPQMTAHPDEHVNLYQMVAALRPSRVTIMPGEQQPQTYDRPRFLQYALQHSCSEAVGKWPSMVARVLIIAFLRQALKMHS
jgi:hypothetical protein